MPVTRFIQLDVFTSNAFQGNPLAVFPDGDHITDEQMGKIAREMNLSETVFVQTPTDAKTRRNANPEAPAPEVLRRLRIFTPMREIPFAGHPIVGTWNALAREGLVAPPEGGNGWTRIYHEVQIGILPVDIEFRNGQPSQVVMTQGDFNVLVEVKDQDKRAAIARAIGLGPEDLDDFPIQGITTGLSCLAVPIKSIKRLQQCRIDATRLADIYQGLGTTGCLAFSRETLESGSSTHARFFAPADNIPEDPATGSACGALGAYLIHHNALKLKPEEGRYKFVIEQGDFINRPSRINLNVKGTAGKVEEVRVGGPSVVVAKGEVFL
ncbi:MAG TPA: PhzF family phenazine biosynthesis protein [Pyrinomonadaceae bacterium]|nr:PhzF family phenazine biosynthesis protein [Pyrinomonadaceae bacterium]